MAVVYLGDLTTLLYVATLKCVCSDLTMLIYGHYLRRLPGPP